MTKVVLVAELGCNWNSIEEAKEMIKATKIAGGDLAKLQLFQESHVKAHKEFKRLRKLVLTEEKAKELFDYGKKIGQEVFFTPFYPEAVDMCERIGVKKYKVRHNDYNNEELVNKVSQTNKPILISMPPDWNKSPFPNPDISFLYCIPKYPTPLLEYINLEKIWRNMGSYYFYKGLSCHSKSITPSLLAISHGATIIEKHVMLEGTDPIEKDWSITFEEFGQLVKIAREMEEIL